MNILLIIADALRRDHMGCYGYDRNTTPTIDKLAREGVLFKTCASNSAHTAPPTISIATGFDSTTHGVMTAQDYAVWMTQDPAHTRRTAIHALSESGYRVGGDLVKRWAPLGFTADDPDRFAFMEANRDVRWFYLAQPYPTHLPYDPPPEYYKAFVPEGYHPDEDSRRRIDVIRRAMICHPTNTTAAIETDQDEVLPDEEQDEAHARSSATVDLQPEDATGIRALYDGEMRVLDDWMAETLKRMQQAGVLDDTLIVLLSDHGEELMERGHVGHSSTNLSGTLYDESMMVPLIMWHPHRLPKGRVVESLVSVIDVMPTIADLLGLDLPTTVDGQSLVPQINDTATTRREFAFAEVPPAGWQRLVSDERRIRAVRTADWKLICHLNLKGPDKRYELYDLQADPGEQHDIYEPEHTQAVRLRAALDARYA